MDHIISSISSSCNKKDALRIPDKRQRRQPAIGKGICHKQRAQYCTVRHNATRQARSVRKPRYLRLLPVRAPARKRQLGP
jgi:hypothetical protein